MKKKGKQRVHTNIGPKKNRVDSYPEIDSYITEALQIADEVVASRTLDSWSTVYCQTMNKLLYKAGLRIL